MANDEIQDSVDPEEPDEAIQKQNTFTLKSMLSKKIVKMPTTIQGQVMEAIAENSEKTSFITDSEIYNSPKEKSPANLDMKTDIKLKEV